jgi:LPS export ABC transporter protein LptC
MKRVITLAVAIGGVVLGACQERKEPPTVGRSPLADSADQIMYKARSLMTDNGLLRAELHADTAYFFDESTRIEMRIVHVTFHGPTGTKDATLTSSAGTYFNRIGTMEARGNVVVITEDGRRLTSPHLKYDQTQDQVSSDSAFVLTEPGRRLEGIGFTSDPNMNNIRCLKACRGESGAVTIPAQ